MITAGVIFAHRNSSVSVVPLNMIVGAHFAMKRWSAVERGLVNWSKGRGRDRDGCCDLMALFPDRMVCGFGPADRSNGGRDETWSFGSVWLTKPHTCTDMHRHARTRTAREWLVGGFTWITQPAETHSVALAFHTLPHTHTPKKKTSYSGNLWLCTDIWNDCWAAFLDKMSHK